MADFDLNAYKPRDTLNAGQIIRISNRMLFNINSSLVLHNERTAFLSMRLAQAHPMQEKCSITNLVILSLFHTLGFLRQDSLYDTNPFESDLNLFGYDKSVESKYMFSFYYLGFMTSLGEDAQALECFTLPFDPNLKKYLYQTEYKSIIYLSARISDYYNKNPDKPLPADINEIAPGMFDPEYAEVFNKCNEHNRLINQLKNMSYQEELEEFLYNITLSPEDTHKILKQLVYFLDFKSTVTFTHSINTSCYAFSLGKRLNLSEEEQNILFMSAIVHDIGKIATPTRILEFPGKLSPEDMNIMRYHVNHTKRILNKIVSDEIFQTAYRHHEKLNGNGYPLHLDASQLNTMQRILTIADITSALTDNRSYKGEFSNERTLGIINSMTEEGELDADIVKILNDNFDVIREEQKELQNLLRVDFSQVLQAYNDYLYNDAELIASNIIDITDLEGVGDLDELDEFDEVDDLEEVEDLEEL